jgi:hypothetical protein
MSDTAAPQPTNPDKTLFVGEPLIQGAAANFTRGIMTTAGLGLGGTAVGTVADWFFQCIIAGHLIQPDKGTSAALGGLALIAGHYIGRIINKILAKYGIDLSGA